MRVRVTDQVGLWRGLRTGQVGDVPDDDLTRHALEQEWLEEVSDAAPQPPETEPAEVEVDAPAGEVPPPAEDPAPGVDEERLCGVLTDRGTPCRREAGWGTEHPGVGPCRYHDEE